MKKVPQANVIAVLDLSGITTLKDCPHVTPSFLRQ
jgi:hypothetical protein